MIEAVCAVGATGEAAESMDCEEEIHRIAWGGCDDGARRLRAPLGILVV